MIEEQCNNCRNHNTAYCIIFDGRSCPAYTEEIDDTISSQEIAGDAPPIHYTAEGLKATTKIRGGIRWFLILIVLIGFMASILRIRKQLGVCIGRHCWWYNDILHSNIYRYRLF